MSLPELELDLGTTTINCTTDEVASALASLLREIRSVARLLRPDERVALRLIMSRDSGTLTVGEVFRDFARDSESHKTLRRLRAAQFVRPAETGRWDPNERIEVKPFARLLWDRVGEGELFAADSEEVLLSPEQEPATAESAEVQSLEAEPADVERAAAKMWEDDSVADFSDADDLRHYVEEELRQNR